MTRWIVGWLLWWSQSGSNRRPSRCKRDALPAELWPRLSIDRNRRDDSGGHRFLPVALRHATRTWRVVGLGGVEPPTSPLSGVRSNQLSYRPGGQASGGRRGLTN